MYLATDLGRISSKPAAVLLVRSNKTSPEVVMLVILSEFTCKMFQNGCDYCASVEAEICKPVCCKLTTGVSEENWQMSARKV